ncbi:MAG: sulfite exporter TauE/SafE family protein [Planctomycetes bacterium]|nr:sulfite exporter TauE/SafE family protein [Planctomycetota bacterium]
MILAWIGALLVGLSLGLLGSGGAILTVPILVYMVGHDEKSAIVESLAIVGAIAVAGTIRSASQKRLDVRSAALLAFPGIAGTVAGAHVARHVPGALQLMLLAGLMLAAALMMFRKDPTGLRVESTIAVNVVEPAPTTRSDRSFSRTLRSLLLIAVQGVGLGFATGLVGVGGGFLIVPVLVLLRKLPMPVAVGTSLAIIAVNCVAGFLKYSSLVVSSAAPESADFRIDWGVVVVFAALGIAGSLAGSALVGRVPQATLKRVFAAFLVTMAAYIIARQYPRLNHVRIEKTAALVDFSGNQSGSSRL